ncbi:phytase [Rhizorhabdus dicambivorans]|uniref:3-phytase n=1 Tax=Rhizorhabdus dicambivorans TaxID=1850238 RepID=A0A2A4FSD6_9SPHN|nr:phytase [Rhizorhabdus dicambivorans]ATE67479.1 3-phytase [Rhizorhabdus dicambivorans]PCE41097.1 3-phytase [Rhizorhabdus dicambivorans]
MARTVPLIALLSLAGCATTATRPAISPAPTASVQAKGETQAVGTANADAADDPAIWRNPADPAASLIVGTDKKAGLYVYDLEGRQRFFIDAGRVNNVDLRDMGAAGIIVAASDRNDPRNAKLALFRLDPASASLVPLGKLAVGPGEAYGICLYREGDVLFAFNVIKDGTIRQVALSLGDAPRASIVRTMKLATQSEGCTVDERTHRLYVAEEDMGLWRFDARPGGDTAPVRMAAADGYRIVADTEGVAIAPEGDGDGGYLLVSSQGDNAYAVFRLSDDSYVGRFRVTAGAVGSTEETDGIDFAMGDFGTAYPGGLLVVQDGRNMPRAQNFKLVDWASIKAALGIR